MKFLQITSILIVITCTLTSGQNTFIQPYGYDSSNYYASDIVETMDGGFLMTGVRFAYNPGPIPYEGLYTGSLIVRTNSYGDTIWTRNFEESMYGRLWKVFEMPDSTIVLLGNRYTSGLCLGVFQVWPYSDYVYLKLDKDGNFMDFVQYTLDCQEVFIGAIKTQDGGFAILGIHSQPGPWTNPPVNPTIDKLNSNGTLEWTKFYSDEYYEVNSLVQDTNENYFFTGLKYNGIDYDAILVKTDVNGDTLFEAVIPDTSWQNGINLIEADALGNFLITVRDGSTSWNYTPYTKFYKVDGAGSLIWSKTYEFIGYESILTSDGGFIVLGTELSQSPYDSLNMYVVKLNSNGDSLWSKSYGGIKRDLAASITLTSDGGYAALGTTDAFNYVPTPSRYFLAKDTLLFTGLNNHISTGFETKIYPNPFQQHSKLELYSKETLLDPELKIYDCSGRDVSNHFRVSENRVGFHHEIFEIVNLKNQGLFIFKIFDKGKLISIGKFLTIN